MTKTMKALVFLGVALVWVAPANAQGIECEVCYEWGARCDPYFLGGMCDVAPGPPGEEDICVSTTWCVPSMAMNKTLGEDGRLLLPGRDLIGTVSRDLIRSCDQAIVAKAISPDEAEHARRVTRVLTI
jgi:hypothetical protein